VTAAIACHPARVNNGLLQRALGSVMAQTRQVDAILVVNDVGRRGAGWTRRTLLNQTDTEWIAWIDSDDEWLPEHVEKLMMTAALTDSVYVYSWFHANFDPLGHFGLPFNACTPHHTTMCVLERTDIAKEVGFPDSAEGNFSNEDWAHITGFAKLCCERGLTMTHLAERTWNYHQGHGNSSGQPSRGDAH
jgi:hypothetical protein